MAEQFTSVLETIPAEPRKEELMEFANVKAPVVASSEERVPVICCC